MGELDEMLDLETFTGIKFRVPVLEKNSPLALCIAFHMHYNVANHKGSESVYRVSLQHAKIINGKSVYEAVEEDCIRCKILKKRYLEQMMGPLADSQISLSPVFYFSLLDLWGPLRTYCPGYERTTYTRGTVSYAKHYEVYYMVVACVVTGAVNVRVVEKKNTGAILDGLSRFMNECCVPKVILPDADGAMMEALRDGVIELADLEGTLAVEYGINFQVCLPQGHWEHGRVERRIRMLQESLERSGLKGIRCHATGLQTIAKAIERQVNDVPLGLLEQSTRKGKVLRILTPNMLKMNTRSNRAPKGLLTIPGHASDLVKNIEKGFNLWYKVWNDVYLPMAAQYKKWPNQAENISVGHIVLFKLKDSVLASTWRIGKVEDVHTGRDGLVRGADVSYKNMVPGTDDMQHMVVQRPVKQLVKLFHINDTTLLSDISKVRQVTREILADKNKNKLSEDELKPVQIDQQHDIDTVEDIIETENANPDNVKVEPDEQSDEEEVVELKQEIKEESQSTDDEDLNNNDFPNQQEGDLSEEEILIEDNQSPKVSPPYCSKDVPEEETFIFPQVNEEETFIFPQENEDTSTGIGDGETLAGGEDEQPNVEENQTKEKKRRKTEMERLQIENDRFWKDFDERRPRVTVSCSFLPTSVYQANLTSTKLCEIREKREPDYDEMLGKHEVEGGATGAVLLL